MMEEQIYTFLMKLIAYGGGSATIAYLLFQHLGKTWLDNKFAQRLDELRHQQNIEVQRLRVEIDSLLSAAIRIQEKEFQILPTAWEKLDEAYSIATWAVHPFQQYTDVDNMSADELEEFLNGTTFTNTQKAGIKYSHPPSKEFQRLEVWRRIHKAKSAHGDLQAYVARNGILMPAELKENLKLIIKKIHSALVSKEVGHQHNDFKMQSDGWEKFETEVQPLYEDVEKTIQSRLASHAKEKKSA